MHGVVQRQASGAAYVRQRGGQTDVHWRTRPPAQPSRGRKRRRDAGARDIAQAFALIAVLVVLTAVVYVRAGRGVIGL